MIRARFYIKKSDCGNDYRPVKWPIKYPYWCSGESDDSFILVAYAEDEDSIKELWPEAYDINVLEKDTEVKFTLRFPKPKWYELQEERLEEYDKLYGKFVWVTDMCLKDGKIRKVKARIEDCGGLLLADTPGRYTPYQIGDCAFESKEEALKHAEEQRTNLIKSLVDFCKSNNIGTIIIGLNKEWKNEINIGKRNNQHFVSIPHSKLIDKIVYKANLLGIEVITHEESYTSKIDHLAFEPLKKQESYLGRRKKRGLFQSSIGELINADINGAIGIARKVIGDSFIGKIIDSGFVFNPVRINIL